MADTELGNKVFADGVAGTMFEERKEDRLGVGVKN
jgi:hypothetical protein